MTTAIRTVIPEFQHDLLHVGILDIALYTGLDLQQALEHPHDRLEIFGLGRQTVGECLDRFKKRADKTMLLGDGGIIFLGCLRGEKNIVNNVLVRRFRRNTSG